MLHWNPSIPYSFGFGSSAKIQDSLILNLLTGLEIIFLEIFPPKCQQLLTKITLMSDGSTIF